MFLKTILFLTENLEGVASYPREQKLLFCSSPLFTFILKQR